ncbi:hypothetical protein HK096_010052 [Nowakowskiella sp. JEL0078]|nr:hypothetical protein HK096_010052 [Nowakowskiella sp. JEL0078]
MNNLFSTIANVDSLSNVRRAVRLDSGEIRAGGRTQIKGVTSYSSGAPRATTQCQKCLEQGHWSYECKNERKYLYRPSRTRQLGSSENMPSEKLQRNQTQHLTLAPREGLATQILKEKKANRLAAESDRDSSEDESESEIVRRKKKNSKRNHESSSSDSDSNTSGSSDSSDSDSSESSSSSDSSNDSDVPNNNKKSRK